MKLYRFMHGKELQDLLLGKVLVNTCDQNKDRGKKSTAVGFCFGIGDYEQAKIDFRRLNGIVTPRIPCCLRAEEHQELHQMQRMLL